MNQISILSRLTTSKGFILADVLVAILFLSIALVPISGLFIQGIKANAMAKDYTVAANLAQKQLELLKTRSTEYWSGLPLPCTIPWQDEVQLPSPSYLLTTQGIVLADEPLVQVTVMVSWQEHGKDCNLQFVTLYPKL